MTMNKNTREKFAKRLKMLREEKKLTQRELAEEVEMSYSSIAMYESAAREPDFEKLELFADYFNVDFAYLVGQSNIRNLAYENVNPLSKLPSQISEEIIVLARNSDKISKEQADQIANFIKFSYSNLEKK